MNTQPLPDTDPRRAAILSAASAVFARYGFRRSAMEDIAAQAGLSRGALYLHYRNKQDIFRSIVQAYFDLAETRMRAALAAGTDPVATLQAAFEAKIGPEMAPLFESPHGAELLDANFATAADIVEAAEARLGGLIADWLTAEDAAGRLTLAPIDGDAPTLARTMVAALGGLKHEAGSYAALQTGMGRLARLFGRGLRA